MVQPQPLSAAPPASATDPVIWFGSYRFDRTELLLYRGDTEVPLPPRALSVLAHLLSQPGKLVSKQLLLDSTSDAVAALKANRGVAFAEDSTLLLGLTLKDASLKVVGDDKAETPWGIGIKQGDQAKQYVDAVLADLQAKDKLWEIFGSVVTDPKARDAFAKNMPRPGQNIAYTDEDTLADCS